MTEQQYAPTEDAATPASTPSISAAEAVRHVEKHGPDRVVDVRTHVEVGTESLPGARHIPLDELPRRCEELRGVDGDILILCRSGKRAESARNILAEAGVRNAAVIEGGILAFAAAGGATVQGSNTMSLERQVRIAAGALVLFGVALGFFVHQAGFGLSAFVGAGLVFAGLTDTCGMGMMLAKMPWNRATGGR